MMKDVIKSFPKQFEYTPVVENEERLEKTSQFIVAGMGGSALAAEFINERNVNIHVIVHRNYGLPAMDEEALKQRLVIVSSYSGNTEESIDAFHTALERGIPLAALSTGGQLIELAQKNDVPYVQLPEVGIQPRMATGYSLKGLLALMGDEQGLAEADALSVILKSQEYEEQGRNLATALEGKIPIIYTSERNRSIAYNWKIRFNETGKIPAFYNVFPELNHNEMNGIGTAGASTELSKNFSFVFLKDSADHPRVQKRMVIMEQLLKEMHFPIAALTIEGVTPYHKIFSSLLCASWAAYYTAERYHTDPEQVPLVEKFKRLMNELDQ